jgi:hypothetical protein
MDCCIDRSPSNLWTPAFSPAKFLQLTAILRIVRFSDITFFGRIVLEKKFSNISCPIFRQSHPDTFTEPLFPPNIRQQLLAVMPFGIVAAYFIANVANFPYTV